jgi:hypothetical protein
VAGNSFQHFSNSYTLTDQYYHSLSSDATILVSHKCPAIGEPLWHNGLPWQHVQPVKNTLNFSFKCLYLKSEFGNPIFYYWIVIRMIRQGSYSCELLKFHDFQWPFPWPFRVFQVKQLFSKYCQNNLLFKVFSHIMTYKMCPGVYFYWN